MARHTNIYELLTDLDEGRDYQPQSRFTGGAPSSDDSLLDARQPADATLSRHSHEHSCDKSTSDSSNASADQSATNAPLQASDQFRKRPRRRPSKKHKFELLERPDVRRTRLPLARGSLPHHPPLDNTQGLYALAPQLDGTKLEIGPQNMATSANASFGDARRNLTSPRPRGRENTKNIPCRNITIYGNCRYENDGCLFNHDRNVFAATAPANTATTTAANTATTTAANTATTTATNTATNTATSSTGRSRFNADSPSFTPTQATLNGAEAARSTTISPKSANAAIFTPKTNKSSPSASTLQPREPQEFKPRTQNEVQEFNAQSLDQTQIYSQHDLSAVTNMMGGYDPFTNAMQGMTNSQQQTSLNPYQDLGSMAATPGFYNPATDFQQPIQYHLYAPMGTDRKRLEGYQRLVHDLFMPQDLREDLQKKSEATLRILPTSNLPTAIAHFHSLYPLDTSATKNANLFGYPTSIYKAKSAQDGRYYALRRVEGFRLTSEAAIHTVQKWKQVRSAGLVAVHEAFTTREFGDSSLILITDYHPNSKTLLEKHFTYNSSRPGGAAGSNARGQTGSYVREDILWSYIVQLSHALKSIHSAGLAARVIHPSKVLLSSKNRIRLNGCAITDIVTYESLKDVKDAQQDDFVQFGKLILSIASSNANAVMNVEKAVMNLTRLTYSNSLKQTITWLLNPPPSHSATTPIQAGAAAAAQQHRPGTPAQAQPHTKDIDTLLQAIALQSTRVLESALAAEDQLLSSLMSELENGRLVRLLAKLGCINERPEYEHNPQWSETGERYYLKLFRDYVFHQVNADGTPNIDLGHIVACLNKLDAGAEERVCLTSRDEQTCLVVSYKELKKGVESAFNELLRTGRR